MSTPRDGSPACQCPPGTVPDRDEHEFFDPDWLKNSYTRCLWDGGPLLPGSRFCSEECSELYLEWSRHPVRPEPPEGEVIEYPHADPRARVRIMPVASRTQLRGMRPMT